MAVSISFASCGGSHHTASDANIDTARPVDATIDALAPAMDIHGVGTVHFVTDTGVVDKPRDFSFVQFTSITPDGAHFDRRVGTSALGTFTVGVGQDAPSWDLGITFAGQGPFYVVGNSTAPDLSAFALGRSDAVQAPFSTLVTVNATGLAPWQATDDLEIVASNANAIEISPQGNFGTPLATNATTIAAQTFDWGGTFFPHGLVVAAQGDVAVMCQLSTKTSGSDQYTAIAKLGTATGFTQAAMMPSTLTAMLADVTPNESLAVHWKRSQFEALNLQAGPSAIDSVGFPPRLTIDALPGGIARGYFTGSVAPHLVEFFHPLAGSSDIDETFAYANPFSTGGVAWDEIMTVQYFFAVHPSATLTLSGGYFALVPVATLQATGVIAPLISGVTGITVGGKNASAGPQTGVGLTPMISWTAPSIGTPSVYAVTLYTDSGAPLVTFTTAATSLQLPDQLMMSGVSYALEVDAIVETVAQPVMLPIQSGLPYAVFAAVTSEFQS
jgi:hypothetical protein